MAVDYHLRLLSNKIHVTTADNLNIIIIKYVYTKSSRSSLVSRVFEIRSFRQLQRSKSDDHFFPNPGNRMIIYSKR